jgi:head-tail adaptor
MIPPKLGELREYISFVNVTAPYDGESEGTVSSTEAYAWAKITPLAGGIVETTLQEQTARQGYDIWIRYKSGITAFQQIVWGSKRLVMTGPPEPFDRYGNINGRHWMLIHAEEKATRTI